MTWLLILGLIGWCAFLMNQVADLKARLDAVERRQAASAAAPKAEAASLEVPAAPAATAAEPAVAAPEVPAPEVPAPVAPPEAPVRVRPLRPAPSRAQVRAWLEENGLAWAGGVVLGLGGLFLVTYAAQRGVFTPPLRIAAAVLVGVLMLAASEWLRRQPERGGAAPTLAAAVVAGAGAATLYGAVWAAYWLYAFIGLPMAGSLMALVALGLLGLSFRHGEPLAILAILGGFLAPIVTGPRHWAAPALTADLALIMATGYLVAGARRWGRAGMATLVGAAAWALAGFAAQGYARVAALAVGPAVLACLVVEWRRLRGDPAAPEEKTSFARLPDAALVVGALLALGLWLTRTTPEALTAAVVAAAAMAGLAAIGARRGLMAERIQAVGYAPVAGAALLFTGRPEAAQAGELVGGLLMVVGVGAGLWAMLGAPTPRARLSAAAGALAALLVALAARGPLTAAVPWAPAAGLAVVLVACAAVLARRSAAPQADLALAVWIWVAGAAALWALPKGFGPRALPLAAATLSVLAAAFHRRLGWRGFAAVAVAAALAALGALLRPAVFKALFADQLAWWAVLAIGLAAAALVYAASRLSLRPDRPRETAEALGTGALLIGLAGAFLALRQLGMAGAAAGAGLDPFSEASLRTLLLLAAGLLSAQGAHAESSLIGRWRGQWLLLAGLAHGVVFQLLLFDPLFAGWRPRVAGPRLLDSLALGLLAPALLLAAATRRRIAIRRELLALYAGAAGVFAVAWLLLETRRLFQGADLHGGLDLIGRAEACAYAIVALATARALLWCGETAARRPWTVSSLSAEIVAVGRGAAWGALGLALLVFGWGASPWWGPNDRPLAGAWAAALLFAGYAGGGLAAGALVPAAERLGAPRLARAARLGVVAIAFALLNVLVRYAFHGPDMRADLQEMSFETWTLSAGWGVLGFGLLVVGVARRSNDLRGAGLVLLLATTAKIFLFDMARLEGVVRAGSFLAVGALLLAAAVLVRRLGGGGALPPGLRGRREPPADAP